jgi:hypothetical protein
MTPRQPASSEHALFPARRFLPRPIVHVLIAAIALAVSSCADQEADRGHKLRSITYQFTDQTREARERDALQAAQDECYLAGDTYAQLDGPPQITTSNDGTAGKQYQAIQSFYCVGMRGEG